MEQDNRWHPLAKMIAAIILEEIRKQMKSGGPPKSQKEFLTVKDLSEATPFTPIAIYRMVHKRTIPFNRKGRKLVFEWSTIVSWLRENAI